MATGPTTTTVDEALLGARALPDELELVADDDAEELDRVRNAGGLGTPNPLLTVMLKVVSRLRVVVLQGPNVVEVLDAEVLPDELPEALPHELAGASQSMLVGTLPVD